MSNGHLGRVQAEKGGQVGAEPERRPGVQGAGREGACVSVVQCLAHPLGGLGQNVPLVPSCSDILGRPI